VERAWALLPGNLDLNEKILGINAALLLDELNAIPQFAEEVATALANLRDLKAAELQALWAEAYTIDDERWQLRYEPFVKFMILNNERISTKGEALNAQLNQ
jgi:hypothetical protein